MVNVNLKIQKKDLFLLAAIVVFFAGVGYIIAYGGTSPTTMGHSAGELYGVASSTHTHSISTTTVTGAGKCGAGFMSDSAICVSGYTLTGCTGYFGARCYPGDSGLSYVCGFSGSQGFGNTCTAFAWGTVYSSYCVKAYAICAKIN